MLVKDLKIRDSIAYFLFIFHRLQAVIPPRAYVVGPWVFAGNDAPLKSNCAMKR
ncbi:hypothetical protein HDF15_000726 [Granulicella mallensis]|jgi:hypothetical protein|uniref:Uncharacterized protein n=1 Tax=Granulicella mallensis TaxID=940614 RepID=A0A7W7ZNF2_9BACT|nr:hypothetical protein [Granulicella mallensis]